MNYIESFDLFGVPARQIPCIKNNGAPTTSTEGDVGMLCMDTSSATYDLYKCVSAYGGHYTWKKVAESEVEQTIKEGSTKAVSGGAVYQALVGSGTNELKNIANLVVDCLENVAWATTYGASKVQVLKDYITLLGDGSNLPDSPEIEPDDYEIVRVIVEDEILHLCGYTENPPYYTERNVRECYPYFDVPMEYGYTYKFEWTTNCSEEVLLGGQYYNQKAVELATSNSNINKIANTIDGAKWYSSGETFMLPAESKNGSPMVGIRFHFRKANDAAFVAGAGVTSVTIKRKAGRDE